MSIDMATSRPQKLAYNNQVGLFRLHTLLTDGGNLVVRRIFIHKLHRQKISLTDCLTEENEVILNLIKKKKINRQQLKLLFPDDGHHPTIESLDLMLTIELLQNLRIFCLKSYFGRKPGPNELSVVADLARLKEYHNRFSYASGLGGIDEEDFNIKWADIVAILQRLNSSLPEPDSGLQKIIDDDIVGKRKLWYSTGFGFLPKRDFCPKIWQIKCS